MNRKSLVWQPSEDRASIPGARRCQRGRGLALAAAAGLANAQGDAYHRTTLAMYAQATNGKDKPPGAYHVGYAIEYAGAYWHFPEDGHGGQTARANQPPGKLRYSSQVEASGAHNAHVAVAVLLQAAAYPGAEDIVGGDGVVTSNGPDVADLAPRFIAAIAQHRFWSRELKAMPA